MNRNRISVALVPEPSVPSRRMPGRALWLSGLLTLLALASGCSDPAEPANDASTKEVQEVSIVSVQADSGARLDNVIKQYAATQRDEDQNTQLRMVTEETFFADINANRDLLSLVKGIDADALSLDERIDRRLLVGLLESDIYSAQDRRLWEKDASIYVPAGQIGRLLESASSMSPVDRADALMKVLEGLPTHLEIARKNLSNPPRRFTEAAIFKSKGTLDSLRTDGDTLAASSGSGEAKYSEALKTAISSLEKFAGFLEDELLAESDGTWAVGKEHYDYVLKHRWFFDEDADQILVRGREAFAATEKLAQELAEQMEPGKHWSEVYERLKDDHPPADGIKAGYQRWIDAAQEFVIDNQIVTLPAGERVVTVDTPPAMRRSSPFGTFQSVDRFGTDLVGKLVLTPIENWMSAEQQAERLRSHHSAWLPVIAVHEAYPGHHVHALKTRENERFLRKVVGEPIFAEGWGLFTEELMFELGFLEGDDVRLTQLRNRLWRAARVILDVSLHTGQMTFDEAVDFLVERVRFERYAAELEVGMYTVNPTYVLGYLIGMEEIMSIRDDWIEINGEPDPPSEFYDPLLRAGSLPPALIREILIGSATRTPTVPHEN